MNNERKGVKMNVEKVNQMDASADTSMALATNTKCHSGKIGQYGWAMFNGRYRRNLACADGLVHHRQRLFCVEKRKMSAPFRQGLGRRGHFVMSICSRASATGQAPVPAPEQIRSPRLRQIGLIPSLRITSVHSRRTFRFAKSHTKSCDFGSNSSFVIIGLAQLRNALSKTSLILGVPATK